MNCLEFRRQLLIDPLAQSEEASRHEAGCETCAAYAREVRAQEIQLRAVLNEVRAPDGMADRVLLAARFEQRAEVRRRWWYGAAAGVLMAIGVSMFSVWTSSIERGGLELAQSVINHIEDESHHLREALPVSAGRVKWVFRRFGAELAADIGPIHFAAECLMRERNGVHLVMPGKMGPITVFFMPGEMTDRVLSVDSARFDGEIVPTRWGSIAVVGESGEALDGMGRQLASAVRWPTRELAGSGTAAGRLVDRRLFAAAQQ